jgi:hypothetical protein
MALPPKPNLTPAPVAPTRGEAPATFATKAQAFVNWQANNLQPEVQDGIDYIAAAADQAEGDASSALNSRNQAVAAAAEAQDSAVSAGTAAETAETAAAAAQSAAGLPSLVGKNGFVLTVNSDALGVSWQPAQAFGASETFVLGM